MLDECPQERERLQRFRKVEMKAGPGRHEAGQHLGQRPPFHLLTNATADPVSEPYRIDNGPQIIEDEAAADIDRHDAFGGVELPWRDPSGADPRWRIEM